MKLYDLSTGEIAWQVDIGQRPTAIRYSQDGSVLGVGDDAGTVRIISANNGVTHSSVNNPGNTITDIAFSTDGTRLAVSTDVSRAVRLYSIIGPSYNLSEQWYRNHSLSVKAVAFAGSGSGADVLSAGLDGTVRRWSPTGTPSGIISAHTDEVLAVAVYPDDTLVATAGKDNTIRVFNVTNGQAQQMRTTGSWVTSLAFAPNGDFLVSGDRSGNVRLWSVPAWNNTITVSHPAAVLSVAVSPDSSIIASAGEDSTIRLWSATSGASIGTIGVGVGRYVYSLSFSPDGLELAGADNEGYIRIWRVSDREQLRQYRTEGSGTVYGIALSPNNALLAAGEQSGKVTLWNRLNGTNQTLGNHVGPVHAVAFSPNGAFVISAGDDNTVRYWSLDGSVARALRGHAGAVNAVAATRSGLYIASAGNDAVAMWRVRDQMVNTPPDAPTLFLPEDRQVVPPQPQFDLLTRDAQADRIKFLLELTFEDTGTIRTFETELVNSGVRFTYTLPQELASGNWTWRAKAIDSKGSEGEWSSTRTFLVNRRPLNLQAEAPADNTITAPAPTFQLRAEDPEGDQVRFLIELKQPDTDTIQTFETDLADSGRRLAYTLPQELASGNWTWRAKAIDSKGFESDWSESLRFTVNRVPLSVQVSAPEDNAVTPPTPTFQLQAEDAEGDQVRFILELTQGDTTLQFETDFTDSGRRLNHTLPQELASGNWTWRAKAIDSKGSEGEWSSTRTFLVNRRPLNLQAEAPADNTITAPAPTFQLRAEDPEGDQVRFLIELKQPDTDTIQTFETDLADSGRRLAYTLPQELASGNWTWRAKAIDSKGFESDWSESLRFTVNRVPLSVQVSAPEDNAVTPPTPTFQLQAEDAEGDQVRFILELTQGDTTLQFETDFTDSGRRFTYTLPRELTPGEWQVRAKVVDAKGSESPFSSTRRFVASPDVPGTIPARLTLWSISLSQNGGFTKAQLGLADVPMVRWEPASQQFVQVAPDEPLLPGRAYWLKPSSSVRLQVSGQVASGSLTIPLVAGWNQIGNPFLSEIAWDSSSVRVRRGSEERTLSQATAAGWITGHLWAWQPNPSDPSRGQYVLVSNLPNTRNRLQPWQGYWLYAHEACELILSPTRAGSRSATGEQGNAWLVTLRVHLGKDTAQAHIGACGSASPVSVPMPPDPPMTSCGVRLGCVRNGTLVAADLAPARSMHTGWNLVVQVPPTDQQTATLTWQGVHTAPRDSNLILVDLQTGTRHFLLTTGAYTFAVSPEGGEYRFRIETVPVSRLLHISNVQVRGGRSAGNTYTISYTLSTDARVEVSVLRAGKVVRRLASAGTRAAGVQQITWDGRDSNGIALPNGAYLVEVKASSSDGQVVRHIVPVVLTR